MQFRNEFRGCEIEKCLVGQAKQEESDDVLKTGHKKTRRSDTLGNSCTHARTHEQGSLFVGQLVLFWKKSIRNVKKNGKSSSMRNE